MPVYDLGYRKYEGTLRSRAVRWAPIARTTFRNSVSKAFVMVLVAAGIPFLISALAVYAEGTGVKDFIKIPMPHGTCGGAVPIALMTCTGKPTLLSPICDCHRSAPTALAKVDTMVAQSLQLTIVPRLRSR